MHYVPKGRICTQQCFQPKKKKKKVWYGIAQGSCCITKPT
uniref:Uncharacterized protein n=1 Tax=Rhizophora mucronata TaxID=61149 RepID=A0A2P2IPE7_RHIMU